MMEQGVRNNVIGLLAAGICLLASACVSDQNVTETAYVSGDQAALIGQGRVPLVHLMENHSSALIAWRRAGVRDRVVLHIDGHADLDWIPDETVARIAAARPNEMAVMEMHPCVLDHNIHERFAIWNFLYPASRLGLIREIVWVVPDGTFNDTAGARRFVREIFTEKIEMVGIEEALSFHLAGGLLQGVLLGIPITICELDDLPEIKEPVILDLDLDFFTTKSALSQYITERPWISPDRVIEILQRKGIRTDVATLSLSSIGGYLPPQNRWLGPYIQERLRSPGKRPSKADMLREAAIKEAVLGRHETAVEMFARFLDKHGESACELYNMALSLEALGKRLKARKALARAATFDPVLRHDDLMRGDRLWANGEYARALPLLERYLKRFPDGKFSPYAMRRKGSCLAKLDRLEEARETYKALVEIVPQHADSLLDLGLIYRDMKAHNRAIGVLCRARKALPTRSTYALALGHTMVDTGNTEEGVAELEAAVVLRPCSVYARRCLAAGLQRLGRKDEAIRHVQVAMRLEPADIGLRQLAGALGQQGVTFVDGPPPGK